MNSILKALGLSVTLLQAGCAADHSETIYTTVVTTNEVVEYSAAAQDVNGEFYEKAVDEVTRYADLAAHGKICMNYTAQQTFTSTLLEEEALAEIHKQYDINPSQPTPEFERFIIKVVDHHSKRVTEESCKKKAAKMNIYF